MRFAVGLLCFWCGLAAVAQAQTEPQVPAGAVDSIGYLRTRADKMGPDYAAQAAAWRARADSFDAAVRSGRDPYPEQRGKIVTRAYRSKVTDTLQGYSVYLPPGYDPAKEWPLVVVLHGGSSNGNLFLGVVLGNNMNWKEYPTYWWNEFEAQWKPDCIVVSPDGFGQLLWRWMAEDDVRSVIADTVRHYRVDADRVVLAGLSNGGVGAYAIGTRHASDFSVVQAMAGAPSWLQYTGGSPRPEELRAMRPLSGMDLAENVTNTDFRYYHGRTDTGPMKPRFVEEWEKRLAEVNAPAKGTWYDAGHDILYMVEKHGRTFGELEKVSRNDAPDRVRLVTGDYRAAAQHWLSVTRIRDYPTVARMEATRDGGAITVATRGVDAFAIDVRAALAGVTGDVNVTVDGAIAYQGDRAPLGDRAHFVRTGNGFALGFPSDVALRKRPGISGPLTDAYFDHTVHVFGTGNPETAAALEKAARTGAKGWPVWLWNFEQPVLRDTELTPEVMQRANVVLYTTGDDNAAYTKLRDALPIRIGAGGVTVGGKLHAGAAVGTRFIYPNPAAPGRYVVVQGGPSTEAVLGGGRLPDFVPDYVVYDARVLKERPRLVMTSKAATLAMGFFGDDWRLAGATPTETGDEVPTAIAPEGALAVPPAPPPPTTPTTFLAPVSDQAGAAARQVAKRVASFPSYRTQIAGAEWRDRPDKAWRIRPRAECEAELTRLGVPFKPYEEELTTPVPAPVTITGPVGGVTLRMLHGDRPLLFSCELAVRLPALAAILAKHGVKAIGIISAYRDSPFSSFHTFGLAIDISKIWFVDGRVLKVDPDFAATPGEQTCSRRGSSGARTASADTDALRDIACAVAESGLFSSALTPNYNVGHRDHMHFDARPDDARFFVR